MPHTITYVSQTTKQNSRSPDLDLSLIGKLDVLSGSPLPNKTFFKHYYKEVENWVAIIARCMLYTFIFHCISSNLKHLFDRFWGILGIMLANAWCSKNNFILFLVKTLLIVVSYSQKNEFKTDYLKGLEESDNFCPYSSSPFSFKEKSFLLHL